MRAGAQVRAAVDGARGLRARGERGLDGLVHVHHEPRRLRGLQARRARPPRVYACCFPTLIPPFFRPSFTFTYITYAVLTCSGLEMELAENIYTRAQPGAFLPCAYCAVRVRLQYTSTVQHSSVLSSVRL